jgi:hypothetical protein
MRAVYIHHCKFFISEEQMKTFFEDGCKINRKNDLHLSAKGKISLKSASGNYP